jgi:glutathione S-transferase
MVHLYHCPQTTSDRVRWLLRELAVDYEPILVNLMVGDHRKPEYLKINPNGLVPALVDGETVIFESAAIIFYLAEKFGAKMLPPAGTAEKAAFYQWIVFTSTSLDPPAFQVLLHTALLPEGKRSAAVAEENRRKFDDGAGVLERGLDTRQYLVGNTFGAADVMVAGALQRALGLGLLAERPALVRYVERLTDRPAAPFGKTRA